jgi:tripartite-type tricarboxylate transporter receptor subunit TctC
MHAWLPALALLFAAAPAGMAQEYPAKPVRLILPYAAGGPTDIVSRLFAQKLGEALGQQFVADNRGGAGGIIACELAARAIPDGYTLLMGAVGVLTINPHLRQKLPFDPQRDFQPVSLLSSSPYLLLVNPGVPARSVKELVALAQARPGQLNYASGGVGTGNHLSAELLKLTAGVDLTHIPYKGASLAVGDLISGQVQALFVNVLPALPHVRSGKARALAVTSARRSTAAPDIPTFAESGYPGIVTSSSFGLLAPARTPSAIVKRLHGELAQIARQPAVRERLEAQGAEVIGSTPEEFAAFIRSETERWGKVIKTAGIKAD